VVREFLDTAKTKCPRRGYRFKQISGTRIPLKEKAADFVCFFSVFTHLLHEDSYNYLVSAKRVLKFNGKIVFSFLAFDEEEHWPLFDQMLRRQEASHHDQFVTLRQLEIWAEKLGLKVDLLEKGSTPYFPLEKPVELESGARFETLGSIGQGVCILSKTKG
jgi:SAM-dependent methyltransferase